MNSKMTGVLRMVPMAFVMGTIFFLSHKPGYSLYLPPLPGVDKLAHIAIYSVLAGTILYAFKQQIRDRRPYIVILLTIIICLAYGVTDEFHQSFVVGRFASVSDVVADCIGAFVACALWGRYRKPEMVS